MSNKPESLQAEGAHGYYTYGLTRVVPDYARWLPQAALRISRERVETEFGDWVANTRAGGNTMTLVSKVPNERNPLVAAALIQSPVLPLGNGQTILRGRVKDPLYHGMTGDVWPVMDDGDFYVLTSHVLTPAERAKYTGAFVHLPPQDSELEKRLAACDEFLNQLIDKEHVHYWIFLVKRGSVGDGGAKKGARKRLRQTPVAVKPEQPEATAATTTQDQPQPMDTSADGAPDDAHLAAQQQQAADNFVDPGDEYLARDD